MLCKFICVNILSPKILELQSSKPNSATKDQKLKVFGSKLAWCPRGTSAVSKQ